MNKEEIIRLVTELFEFKLDLDRFGGTYENGRPVATGCWMRFCSIHDDLDEKDLRFIWYRDRSIEENIQAGSAIQSRLRMKRAVLDRMKY